ncbi:MAG: Sua5/YciO/YrdC/YwlC family protein [Moraxellaceae bacterium]|nr:Sua5/YciO/YrdC/YwlC family protein [Moraxellaceae bacterium]
MTNSATKRVTWKEGVSSEGLEILKGDGGMIVCPTKVGYIIMTSDKKGLERKFDAKQRNLNKPGVVLCGSMEQLKELAELNPEIEAFYQAHWDKDLLLGCILPWKKEASDKLPDDGRKDLMMDKRGTSCFVIKFGVPGEQIAKALWEEGKMAFASSANPSGKGNRGLVEGIGERIENEADLIIEANDYVASIQPDASVETRYEQGVMVSMVDKDGKLIPEQKGERSVSPAPVVIRKGIYINEIMFELAEHFNSWDYRHGEYY